MSANSTLQSLPAPREVIHVADRSGRRCFKCGATIAAGFRYREGDRVAVVDEDPAASWRSLQAPNCRPRDSA